MISAVNLRFRFGVVPCVPPVPDDRFIFARGTCTRAQHGHGAPPWHADSDRGGDAPPGEDGLQCAPADAADAGRGRCARLQASAADPDSGLRLLAAPAAVPPIDAAAQGVHECQQLASFSECQQLAAQAEAEAISPDDHAGAHPPSPRRARRQGHGEPLHQGRHAASGPRRRRQRLRLGVLRVRGRGAPAALLPTVLRVPHARPHDGRPSDA